MEKKDKVVIPNHKKLNTEALIHDRATFEQYLTDFFVPISYSDVRNDFEEIAGHYGRDIFTSEYWDKSPENRKKYIVYINGEAYGEFENAVEEAVAAVNEDIVSVVDEVANEMSLENVAVEAFFDRIDRLTKEMLDTLYVEKLSSL